MRSVAPFAYEKAGRVYVCADGPEVFCYSGANDSPMWKQFCEGILVGVGAAGDKVYTVDTDGRLDAWRAIDGRKSIQTLLEVECHGMVVDTDGQAIVFTTDGAVHVSPQGDVTKLGVPGVECAAFSADHQRALVGSGQGQVVLVDLAGGRQITALNMGGAVADVEFYPRGGWAVAVGSNVVLITADLVAPEGKENAPEAPQVVQNTIALAAAPRWISFNFDGVLFACDDGAQRVDVYEAHSWTRGGTIEYTRDVCGVCFGPGSLVGIGLEYADANRIEVLTGSVTRSQAGLGKGADPWFPKVQFDAQALRGAVAQARAGGQPIAQLHVFQGKQSNAAMYLGIGVAVFFLLVCGCSGLSAGLYFFVL